MTGFTLIELMMTIAILAILFLMGISSFQYLLFYHQREIAIETLSNAITLAQQEAFQKKMTITLCGSNNRKFCHYDSDWTKGYILFENPLIEKQPDILNPTILQVFPGLNRGKLHFSGPHNVIHVHPNGMTMNIGSFTYSHHVLFFKIEGTYLTLNQACRIYRR